MAIPEFQFDPILGWNDGTAFPRYLDNEVTIRAKYQLLHDQTRNYINNTLLPNIETRATKQYVDDAVAQAVAGDIPDGAVTTAKLANKAVTATKIADNTITSTQLANSAVTTNKINNKAVTAAKIADNTITATQIANNTITAAKLASDVAEQLAPRVMDGYAIGSIIMSTRTDLGEKWALCNGDFPDPNVLTPTSAYEALLAQLKKNDQPKPQPSGQNVSGAHEMYNGEWYGHTGSHSTFYIFSSRGEYLQSVTVAAVTNNTPNAKLLGIENDGTKYVFFTADAATSLKVYTSTDLTTFTLAKTVTTSATVYSTSYSQDTQVLFDGNYYYVQGCQFGTTSQYVFVFNTSFVEQTGKKQMLINDGAAALCICKLDGTPATHQVFLFQQLGEDYLRGYYFDSSATIHTLFTTTADYGNVVPRHVSVFNSSQLVAWGENEYSLVPNVLFIDRSNITTIHLNWEYVSGSGLIAFLSSDGTRFLKYSASTGGAVVCESIPTSSTTPWSSEWTSETVAPNVNASQFSHSSISTFPRSKDGAIVSGSELFRTKLLPLIPSDECYYYIKVKE